MTHDGLSVERVRSMLCGWVTDDYVIEQLIDAPIANFFDGADP